MYINLYVRNVPVRLVQEFLRRRPSQSNRRCHVYIPYDTTLKQMEIGSIYPESATMRSNLGVFWSKPDLPVVEISTEFFVENVIEQTNEGHAPQFSLTRWGVQRGVSRMRRRLEEGEEPSNNETRQANQVDMPQSIVQQSRRSGLAVGREALREFERMQSEVRRNDETIWYSGRASTFTVSSEEAPTYAPDSERILREAHDIRQRWTRERERMETNGISF